jgi:molybdopterin-binding protein
MSTIIAINARNQIKGRIKEIIPGPVVSEVEIDTAAGVLTSVVTSRSLKDLGFKQGAEVLAIFKSTEVALARIE